MPHSPHARFNAFREMVNEGLGKAVSSLNLLLDSHVDLDVPAITLFQPEQLQTTALLSSVRIAFYGPFTGMALLAFQPQTAARLVSSLIGQDSPPPVLTPLMSETLNEVGNIVINCVIGSMGNMLGKPFDFSLPYYLEGTLEDLLQPLPAAPGELAVLLVITRFRTSKLQIQGDMYLLFELNKLDPLISLMGQPPA